MAWNYVLLEQKELHSGDSGARIFKASWNKLIIKLLLLGLFRIADRKS